MPVESPEDLAIFFDPRDFGVDDGDDGQGAPVGALYTPRDGSKPAYRVHGIFDMPSKTFHPNQWPGGHQYTQQEGAVFAVSAPTFRCAAADLVKGGKSRDTFEIAGTVWEVKEVLPDGTGLVDLALSDATDDAT